MSARAAWVGLVFAVGCGGQPAPERPALPSAPPVASSAPSAAAAPTAPAVPTATAPAPRAKEPPPIVFGTVEVVTGAWLAPFGERVAIVAHATASRVDASPGLGAIAFVAPSPRGDRFAVVAERGVAVLAADGRPLGVVPRASSKGVIAAALTGDGARVALLGERLKVVDVARGEVALDLDLEYPMGDSPGTVQLVFHEGGKHVVAVTAASARVFSLETGKEVGGAHDTGTGATFASVVSPDGRFVAAAADAGHTLKVWRTVPWADAATLGHVESCQNHFLGISFAQGGKRLAATARGKSFALFDTRTWAATARSGAPTPTRIVGVSEDGAIGVAVDDDGNVTPIEIATSKALRPGAPMAGAPLPSPDGARLLEHRGATLVVHDTRNGRVIATIDAR